MLMFQISYDVKDSKKTDNNVVLTDLIRVLTKELCATAIKRPVASTLRVELNVERRQIVWDAIKRWSKKHGVWYIASKIAQAKDSKCGMCIMNGDSSLQEEVDGIFQGLKEEKV